MSLDEFERILQPVSPYDLRSPYSTLYQAVIIGVVRQIEALGYSEPIEFVFDDQGSLGREAMLWYGPIRAMQPKEWQALLGGSPIFSSDLEAQPLQAADCLAWHLRRSREKRCEGEKRDALRLLRKNMHHESWLSGEILESMAVEFRSIVPESDRLNKKASVVQPMKGQVGHISRLTLSEQDEKYAKLNSMMEEIRRRSNEGT